MNAAPRFGEATAVLSTHRSVRALMEQALAGEEPTDVIRRHCRELVTWAKKSGWAGPPYNPEILASLIDIQVEPVAGDIRADARIFPTDDGRLVIQYAVSTSVERQRFSICHEIAHTRFPDCYEETRYRRLQGKLDWKHQELERLCNVGAAELLIPYDDFKARVNNHRPSMQLANTLRRAFGCSMEAMLYRIIDLAEDPCAVAFLSKRLKPREERAHHPEFEFGLPKAEPKYRVDYHRVSKTFPGYIPQHKSAPELSVVYRASPDYFPDAFEDWEITSLGEMQVQAAMLPMIADEKQERVAALFTQRNA